MTPRHRRRETQLAFETLTIEGGLLSPEWLSRVAQLTAGQQAEADYRVPKGLTLRDEIGRYWRIAQAHWQEFAAGRARPESKPDQAVARALALRFVEALLHDCFGFASLATIEPVVIDGRSYPIGLAAFDGRVPVVIAPAGTGLDAPFPFFGDGGRRRTAFGLTQEYLNAATEAAWGLASDGLMLRVLRDNASMTRPAWIDADVARIFIEARYADFAALWLLVHETRFGRPSPKAEGEAPAECALDVWRTAGREEGTRAREELRRGFEEALLALGQGFLAHADNGALRAALQGGTLSREAYFHQLLRLVYRFIFLLTAEERGLLHPPGADEAAKDLYSPGYSLRRLRDRSLRRSAHDRFPDLWQGTKIVFRGLAAGEPRLGLPALGGVFAAAQCPDLDAAKLENRALLLAVFRLSWLKEKSGLVRVNWRDMGPEELGSVYESLLELQPQITDDGRGFAFATGDETKGHARKKTGSYYTPDSLVQVLLDSALEPVVQNAIASHPEDPMGALLRLAIVDPACGSGHFLLAAARRLAAHVARLQSDGTPSAAEYRSALRLVVSRCIHGVDLNPMAVELCKVSLWMEAVEPGLPLTFLDSHIQHGNALLGTTPDLMASGVPDAAWEPIEGDDKKVASALKKRNKAEAAGQRGLHSVWTEPGNDEATKIAREFDELESAADFDPAALARKESQWRDILASDAYRHQRFVADAWCAAFVWPKQLGSVADAAPTSGRWTQIRDGAVKVPSETVETTNALRDHQQYRFFHWHLAFPSVFARGGFDVVLGNPPWEHIEIKEEEWFADDPVIAGAPNSAIRKRLIAELRSNAPAEHARFAQALRATEGVTHLAQASGRYPLCAKGRINTYALFAEHNRALLGAAGRAGFIVPSGLVTDDSTKYYFQSLVATNSLVAVYHFENEDRIFPEVHHAYRFVLLSIGYSGAASEATLVFYARGVNELALADRRFTLTTADFETLNPNTKTCPTFRSRRDADINLAIYRRTGVLWREEPEANAWGVRFMQGLFNMASDSGLFRTRAQMEAEGFQLIGNRFERARDVYLPLIEAKMVHHFDHRFGTYEGQTEAQANQGKLPELDDDAHANPKRVSVPKYWVSSSEVASRLETESSRIWFIGWRRICRSTDQRTLIPSVIPVAAVGDSEFLLLSGVSATEQLCLYANLASLSLDYAARQKIAGTNASFHLIRQLPVIPPAIYHSPCRFGGGTQLSWLLPRAIELCCTARDLAELARAVGFDRSTYRWDAARRVMLRAELDAAFFHLYGLSRDETDHVLGTFPVIRKNDEKECGEYRTKRLILEIYDEMVEAIRTGRPYQTRLDPPPADPRVAHPLHEAGV